MQSFSEIIDTFGYARLAKGLGVPEGTVSSWKSRDVIPSEYWAAVVVLAEQDGIEGITYEALARIRAIAKGKLPRALLPGAAEREFGEPTRPRVGSA